jgi:hypothetical protein
VGLPLTVKSNVLRNDSKRLGPRLSLCRVGAIKSAVGELEKHKLDLVGVQEVRWEGEGYQTVDN